MDTMTEAEEFLVSQGVPLNPNKMFDSDGWHRSFEVRSMFISKYGFAAPNKEALQTIAAASPILEVGAGSGYWSYELRKLGADVIATDPALTRYGIDDKRNFFWPTSYTQVRRLTATKAIARYPERTLLTVWPDYRKDWSAKMLRKYRGKHLFYVGEDEGGCTGPEAFHSHLSKHFTLINTVSIPQFSGIHDRLYHYQRKK